MLCAAATAVDGQKSFSLFQILKHRKERARRSERETERMLRSKIKEKNTKNGNA